MKIIVSSIEAKNIIANQHCCDAKDVSIYDEPKTDLNVGDFKDFISSFELGETGYVNKIMAIKSLRKIMGYDLKIAKDIVDKMCENIVSSNKNARNDQTPIYSDNKTLSELVN